MKIEILARTEIEVTPGLARDAAQEIIDHWNANADSEHTGSVHTEELLRKLADNDEIDLPKDFDIPDEWDLYYTPEEWFEDLSQ